MQQAGAQLLVLGEAVVANDMKTVLRVAHMLATASATVAAPRMRDLAARLEQAGARGMTDDAARMLTELRPAFEEFQLAVESGK